MKFRDQRRIQRSIDRKQILALLSGLYQSNPHHPEAWELAVPRNAEAWSQWSANARKLEKDGKVVSRKAESFIYWRLAGLKVEDVA